MDLLDPCLKTLGDGAGLFVPVLRSCLPLAPRDAVPCVAWEVRQELES